MEKLILVTIIACILVMGIISLFDNYCNQTVSEKDIYIDTLSINGNKHEFIIIKDKSGIYHSPECWCHQK
jgi:hypothetical protein